MSGDNRYKPFQVRNAGTITGLGVAMIIASQILTAASVVVWASNARTAILTEQVIATDSGYLLIGALLMGGAGLACVVVGFIKLCTNVEFLARREVERQTGSW